MLGVDVAICLMLVVSHDDLCHRLTSLFTCPVRCCHLELAAIRRADGTKPRIVDCEEGVVIVVVARSIIKDIAIVVVVVGPLLLSRPASTSQHRRNNDYHGEQVLSAITARR